MLELILTDIELHENLSNGNTFDVWYNNETGTFIAKENKGNRTFKYKLDGDFETIAEKYREEILAYRLGRVTAEDVVTIGDIFMIGIFIEIIL